MNEYVCVCVSLFALTEPIPGEKKAIRSYYCWTETHQIVFSPGCTGSFHVSPGHLITLNTVFFTKSVKESRLFPHAGLCQSTTTPVKIQVGSLICWGGASQGRDRLAGSGLVPGGLVRALEIHFSMLAKNSRGY